jgi:hypothetical protein
MKSQLPAASLHTGESALRPSASEPGEAMRLHCRKEGLVRNQGEIGESEPVMLLGYNI